MQESEIGIMKGPKIVVIGGGTGSFTLLKSLKHYVRDITALVNMSDDGGSTGTLRDELGVLPPGDIRQCLVALSESPRTRELFNYRFEEGSFKGHAFGNIFLTALEKMTGSFAEAVEEAGSVLNISGKVEPMTLDRVKLQAEYSDGTVIDGQFNLETARFEENERPEIRLKPSAAINPDARQAIAEADLVVIAPGNLYCSIAPALVVDGVSEALAETKAKKVYVCNLVTKPGQTDRFSVADYASEIERFMGGTHLDYVLYNSAPPAKELLDRYAHEGEYPVQWKKDQFVDVPYKPKGADLVSREIWENKNASDPIAHTRTLIRHDADRVSRELMRIYFAS